MGAQPPDDKENQPPPRRNALAGARSFGARMALEKKTKRADEPQVRFTQGEKELYLLRDGDRRRLELVHAVKRDQGSADKWLELLNCPPSFDADFQAVRKLLWRAKFVLQARRAELRDDPSYAKMCILFAKISGGVDAVRRVYQSTLADGIALKEPMLYEEFAALERREGNIDAMEDILSLGVSNGAYNDAERQAMRERVHAGRLASAKVLPVLPSAPKPLESQRERPAANGYSTPHRSARPYQPTTSSLVFTPAPSSKLDTSVVSTTSKIPQPSNGNSGMTTPTTGTRAPPKSQSTTRKSSLNTSRTLGLAKFGGPMRVAVTEYDDSSDDDGMMDLSQQPEEMKSTPSPPTKEEPKPERKFGARDLDYVLKWKSRDEEAKSASTNHSTTNGASGSRQQPESSTRPYQSTHSGFRTPRRLGENGSSSQQQSQPPPPSSLLSARKLPESNVPVSGVRFGASSSTYDLPRSPKRLQVDAGIPLRREADHSPFSASSVSSSSSPPLINAGPDAQTPLDPFGSLKSKVVVKGSTYIKLEQIGSGGSSKVYRMLGPDLKIYALKKIKLKRLDEKSIEQYTNEIKLLDRLKGNPHIIRLVAAEPDPSQRQINVIMEHGEIDLNDRLRDLKDGMDENFLRVIWTQMLQAVHAIHRERIIHGDLKPANFLFVNGALKLIDFGIAKAISNDTTNIERDSQVGTVNYMSPEAIQGNSTPSGQRNPQGKMKVGRASDIWSLGCILYQIVYGKPPFADVHSIIEKFRCIIDPSVPIPFPPLKNKDLEDVIRSCLQRDHRARPTIDGENGLLQHRFLRSNGASDTASSELHVTLENAPEVLSELVQFFRAKGLDTTSLSTFRSIGEKALRLQPRSSYASPRIGYNTQERRTEI